MATLLRWSRQDIYRERLRRSFYFFAREAWHVIDPAHRYIDNWHVGAICTHLQAVFENKIKRLIINILPGLAKSQLSCVLFPGWGWLVNPSWRSMYGSYSWGLASRDHDKTRKLVQSKWYQENGLDVWYNQEKQVKQHWTIDKDTEDTFENSMMGGRQALTVAGGGSGFRGDCAVVDDPLNATKRVSEAERLAASQWWFTAMSTRFNDMENQQRVIIMQRLHDEDLTGEALERGGYEHLNLPGHYDPSRKAKTFVEVGDIKQPFWEDPRTEDRELIFPAKFPEKVMEQMRSDLGENADAQIEQDPTPQKGIKFLTEHWRFYRRKNAPPLPTSMAIDEPEEFDEIVGSVDSSFKGLKDRAKSLKQALKRDYVVIQVWGRLGTRKFLLYQDRARYTFVQTLDQIYKAKELYPAMYTMIVEDKGNGSAIISALEGEFPGITPYNPGNAGKEDRADAVLPQFRAGEIFIPEGMVAGKGEPWIEADFLPEFRKFPKGRNDDQVDATTQVLLPWRKMVNSLQRLYEADLD